MSELWASIVCEHSEASNRIRNIQMEIYLYLCVCVFAYVLKILTYKNLHVLSKRASPSERELH